MPDDFERVKRSLAQTVASCPRYLKQTIPDLFRRYESLFNKPIPFRKLGFRSVEEMVGRMEDAVKMNVDPATNGIYLTYQKGFSAHIDRFREMIMKDKIPSESTKRIAQMHEELRRSGDGNEGQRSFRLQSPPKRSGPPTLPVADSLLDRLATLVVSHKEVWTTDLMQLYRQEYGVELPVQTYGFKDISELINVLEKERPIDVTRFQLSKSAKLVPRQRLDYLSNDLVSALRQLLTEGFFAVPLHKLPSYLRQVCPSVEVGTQELPQLLERCGAEVQTVRDVNGTVQLVFGPRLTREQESALKCDPIEWRCASEEIRSDCHAYRGHIESLENFYIVWRDDMEAAQAAAQELGAVFEASWSAGNWHFTPRRLAAGQVLAVKANDSIFGWERVEVLSLDSRSVLVRSCENGRTLSLHFPLSCESVQSLPAMFGHRPALARRVRLQHLSDRLRSRGAEAVELFKEAGDKSRVFLVYIGNFAKPAGDPCPVGIEANLQGEAWEDLRAWMHLRLDRVNSRILSTPT